VPLAGWKPHTHRSSVERPNPCPNLIVRVTLAGGAPVNGAEVTLHTTDGRTIFQGRTAALALPNGVTTGPGEIALRGATIGDSVSASFHVGTASVNGSAKIESCTSPLIVVLSHFHLFNRGFRSRLADTFGASLVVDAGAAMPNEAELMFVLPEGEDEPFVVHPASTGAGGAMRLTTEADGDELHVQLMAFDSSGHPAVLHGRIARRSLYAAGDHRVKSLGGEVELFVPDGAVPYPTDLLFEDARDVEPPQLRSDDAVLIAPQRICTSHGDDLKRAALLHLEAGYTFVSCKLRVELLRYDETRRTWLPEPARVNSAPLLASATIDRLGVFCLVGRAGDRP
jgi:hypothetical protein